MTIYKKLSLIIHIYIAHSWIPDKFFRTRFKIFRNDKCVKYTKTEMAKDRQI